jgi:acyl-CoA thioesterase-1
MQAPSNAGSEYKKSFDALYPRLASEFAVPLVSFIVPEVSRNPEFLQADGIHPTKEGYTLLVNDHILPAVELSLETLGI